MRYASRGPKVLLLVDRDNPATWPHLPARKESVSGVCASCVECETLGIGPHTTACGGESSWVSWADRIIRRWVAQSQGAGPGNRSIGPSARIALYFISFSKFLFYLNLQFPNLIQIQICDRLSNQTICAVKRSA
jgi:hypothetical protein